MSSKFDSTTQPFLAHLIELRDRILKAILAVVLILSGLVFYANEIYSFLSEPLLKHLPEKSMMIAIDPASPFFTPLKLTVYLSIFLAIPVILYQFWAFVAPGMYKNEKKLLLPLLVASITLFYGGIAFAYFAVFPVMFGFFTATAPVGVAVMTDIARYLDFVQMLFLAFGMCFQVPILTVVLVWTGVITPKDLANKRPYIIVGAFVVGAILTPPDPISQTLLALPMWLLFEIGLLCTRFFVKKNQDELSEKEADLEMIDYSIDYRDKHK